MRSFGAVYTSLTALLLSLTLVNAAALPEEQNWSWALDPVDSGLNLSRRAYEPFDPLAIVDHDFDDDLTLHGKSEAEIAAYKKATSSDALEKAVALSTSATTCAKNKATIWVDVFFRIYHYDSTWQNGYRTKAQLDNVLAKLNSDYLSGSGATSRIRFRYGKGTGTKAPIYYRKFSTKAKWDAQVISQNSPKFYDFLDAVALENRGPRNKYPADARRQLFIYSVNNMQGLGGICYGDVFLSSVYFALPASVVPFKEISATIAHEVGHWFGLWHTFQDGCVGKNSDTLGDMVKDTIPWTTPKVLESVWCPYYSTATQKYDAKKVVDPCSASTPKASVVNAIANFMSYSYSACRTVFTPGQYARMYMFAVGYNGFVPTCGSS